MSRARWPHSFLGRALIILVLVATLSLVVAGGMILADTASARQAATVASVTTLLGGPLLALVGATVIRGGRPLLWDPDWPESTGPATTESEDRPSEDRPETH